MHLTSLISATVIYLATLSHGLTRGGSLRKRKRSSSSSSSDLQPEGAMEVDAGKASDRRQTVVISRGLQGSGKSTAMRTAAMLLGGDWLNQDEFKTSGGNWKADRARFFDSISNSTECGKPYVFVDRMNTLEQHRSDVQDQIKTCNGESPKIVYLQWMHPADEDCSDPVKGSHYREVCLRNLRNRAGRHRSISSNAPIEKIFDDSAKKAQAVTKDELEEYGAEIFDIDVTLDRYGMVNEILRVLGRDKDFTEEQIRDAMQKVADIEKDMKPVANGPKPRMFQLQLSEESTKNFEGCCRI
ncbi:hypothetical protein FOZ60_002743 [Perkinsus olseni]|uniref:tRNA ligase kinase domain-containing protein n=1 Tax=Perkinsus olseni TaxID=32597 RepID=A0A7J6PKL5_PEROL|nr:hypothetical protein FOZ60_002743 [Perkinsus olseni]